MTISYGEKLWQAGRKIGEFGKYAKIHPTNFSNVAEAIVIKF